MAQPTVDEILLECSLHVGIGIPKGKHLTKKATAHLPSRPAHGHGPVCARREALE
jgi:hypothetical protein